MEYVLPSPDYRYLKPEYYHDAPKWRWPNAKFGLEPEELFSTLHDRFNTHKLPLQHPGAFHVDVCEVALVSDSLEEFYSGLEERKNQRVKELREAWDKIRWLIQPETLACPICYQEDEDDDDEYIFDTKMPPGTLNDSPFDRWDAFSSFARCASFDTLIDFFYGFVRDARKKADEEHAKWKEFLRSKGVTKGSTAAEEHNKPESSRNASTSPSGRHDAAETPLQTSESSTARKRKNDEDAQGSEWKRQRVMSESAGDNDAERLAAQQDTLEATEPTSPAGELAETRKMPSNSDDEARDEQPGVDSIENRSLASVWFAGGPQFYFGTMPASLDGDGGASLFNWPPYQENTGMSAPCSLASSARSQSPPNQDPGTIDASQAPPREGAEGPPAKDSAADAADATRHQRVDKGRPCGEQETPSPQKQPSRKKRQERKTSPPIERLLPSKRSSRRDTGQNLLFLGDDATPCVVSKKRSI